MDPATDSTTATNIIIAYLNNPNTKLQPGDLETVVGGVYRAVQARGVIPEPPVDPNQPRPAVDPADSVHHDYLVCLEDGAKLKMLKRYLHQQHGLTPEEYRAKWGLPASYPMVAPIYSERRSQLAKAQGLGRRPAEPEPEAKSSRRRVAVEDRTIPRRKRRQSAQAAAH